MDPTAGAALGLSVLAGLTATYNAVAARRHDDTELGHRQLETALMAQDKQIDRLTKADEDNRARLTLQDQQLQGLREEVHKCHADKAEMMNEIGRLRAQQ